MSVGHAARAFEAAGIATVIIAVKSFEARMRMMSVPRVLLTPQILGRPMGNPFDEKGRSGVLKQAVELFETAETNGTIVDYRP